MKVVLTTDTTHTIRLIPRSSPLGAIVVTLRNEFTEAVSEPSNSFVLSNGYLSVTFDHTFLERDRYQFTVSDDSGIIYRGNIFATTQETQNFKLSEGVYL